MFGWLRRGVGRAGRRGKGGAPGGAEERQPLLAGIAVDSAQVWPSPCIVCRHSHAIRSLWQELSHMPKAARASHSSRCPSLPQRHLSASFLSFCLVPLTAAAGRGSPATWCCYRERRRAARRRQRRRPAAARVQPARQRIRPPAPRHRRRRAHAALPHRLSGSGGRARGVVPPVCSSHRRRRAAAAAAAAPRRVVPPTASGSDGGAGGEWRRAWGQALGAAAAARGEQRGHAQPAERVAAQARQGLREGPLRGELRARAVRAVRAALCPHLVEPSLTRTRSGRVQACVCRSARC